MSITDSDAASALEIRASEQDGRYPRPQLMRDDWIDLGGIWGFAYDDHDNGNAAAWANNPAFDRQIVVPFPPESAESGIGDTGFHPIVWYTRGIADPRADGEDSRVLLHFGAVDYCATVWLNGQRLGDHTGGHTPFSFDITEAIDTGRTDQVLVVRALDDPTDVEMPRGKQDWLREPHDIWYDRTTGIWQPVWLEVVPTLHVERLDWIPDARSGAIRLEVELNRSPVAATELETSIWFEGERIAQTTVPVGRRSVTATIDLAELANGQAWEKYLWSPDAPRLFDARVALTGGDRVYSYFGLRTVDVDRGVFVLNDRPLYLRSVLSQGFWPTTHLAAPSAEALRSEAELIRSLGFNSARVHQKIEDPRFLFWADKLGILIWEEMPSALEFSPLAVQRVVAEWTEAVRRDRSHPSIVTWVPLNESWGVQHIANDQAMRSHAYSLFHLTKALDPTRPVISNDGWEHVDSDIWSIHDYEDRGSIVRDRYADAAARRILETGFGPAGRRLRLTTEPDRGQAVMLTEFGGIRWVTSGSSAETWGYSSASSEDDFRTRVAELVDAVCASDFLAGYCYTQLTDTQQEANGLCEANRTPKLPLEEFVAIFGQPPR